MKFNLPTLKTKRLVLREVTLDDVEAIYGYFSKEEVTRYMASHNHETLEDTRKLVDFILKSYQEPKTTSWTWAITDAQNKCLIGNIGIHEESKLVAEFGFSMSPEYWGKGLMVEAIKAVIEFGFEGIGLVRIQGRCLRDNMASERAMEKAGMTFEGILKKSAYFKGTHHDLKIFAIIDDDFFCKKNIFHSKL